MSYERTWIALSDKCDENANIHGLMLSAGDKVEIRIRGRAREELKLTFKCYNRYYGSIIVLTEDGKEMLVKMSHVIYIKKL